MPHLTLLGDSIFDNATYTKGGPSVIDHLREALPSGWLCDLKAIDGSTTADIPAQLAQVPPGTTHLFLSIGGNDIIDQIDLLDTPVASTAEALLLFSQAALDFRQSYRNAVIECLALKIPLIVCTIYNCSFPNAEQQRTVEVAVAIFNTEILSAALEYGLDMIELRRVCNHAEDYANPIEPSVIGGQKIAGAILSHVLAADTRVGIRVAG
jgi:hypothetical protein